MHQEVHQSMNVLSFADLQERISHRLRLRLRVIDLRRRVNVLSHRGEPDTLQRIHVINLDRKRDRWLKLRRELDRFHDRHGEPLSKIVRRFSAVDARYMDPSPDSSVLRPKFTLADQLTVHPSPLLEIDDEARAREVNMTRQEIAVALSHIEVWKLIANSDVPAALVLEDDVFMPFGFAQNLQRTWAARTTQKGDPDFDLLYLAYRDVGESKPTLNQRHRRRLKPGIWEASAYVLTREGARKLLNQLPAYGPIDLWLNLQFTNLHVFTAAKRLIEQRIDEPSTNSYSILPVLSQVGVITREKPLMPSAQRLISPVIGIGPTASGLTALAKALSMLGYTCISDISQLPTHELDRLRSGRKNTLFNAYVNIGSFDADSIRDIVAMNPKARFIVTSADMQVLGVPAQQLLRLGADGMDQWAALSDFLNMEYPSFPYPDDVDLGQRIVDMLPLGEINNTAIDLKFDKSPWIFSGSRSQWHGLNIKTAIPSDTTAAGVRWASKAPLDEETWKLRDDTFPSNLALFTPDNFARQPDGSAVLKLREETKSVRQFTSAAVASCDMYLYGSFGAELKPSNVSGIITGLFLYRNSPRQEIDIEFLGKDTTKMLVNVFYNPGPDGTKLEYGYRGTPTQIDLGFDASEDFHFYEIDWQPHYIRWKVDGTTVYERLLWQVTPIPDQRLEFNVNLWHSRSTEFAGRLAIAHIPTTTEFRSLQIIPGISSAVTEHRAPDNRTYQG
ncbi:family 16 glycosylhydrolase [Mycobacteroides abscessus]|uniref:family 16 glycosylhydrolase n=1 Tax=Mycobacteroides abscessus TaxID=36809 RepID=UPI0009A6E288|nr:family 16 glycosylhydrolase [Mycobacteroides abscessus]